MTWPGLPTDRTGRLRILGTLDDECQANLVVDQAGKQTGVYLDDTTPELAKWLALAVAKYQPLGQTVFVAVAPGQAGLHHHPSPPVVNLLEVYPYGEGVPAAGFFPLRTYEGYIVQHSWPGSVGKQPISRARRLALLARVRLKRPRYIFLF